MRHRAQVLSITCLALLLVACHGRPLRAVGPRPRTPADGPARGLDESHDVPKGAFARGLRQLEHPRPHVLSERNLETIRRARALRNPANWPSRNPSPTAVESADALAREFAGLDNPAKANKPGGAGINICEIARILLRPKRK